jgi:hypothetical protein
MLGFGLDFAHIARPGLRFGELLIVAVTQHDVRQFEEEGLVRQGGQRAHGEFAAGFRVALRVAVQRFKLDALDLERFKRGLLIPIRDRRWEVLGAVRLRRDEPVRFVREVGVDKW